MTQPRIAVVGTGANGAAIGADMVRAGLDVTFVEQWPAHVEAMRADGLLVRSPDGSEERTEVNALHLCEVATLREPFDVVFLGVKAYDTRWVCELIKPLVAADGVVCGLQNGMTIDDVASIVGPERTVGAVIEIAGNMFEPGIVNRQTGRAGTWFAVGAFEAPANERVEQVATLLRHAGRCEVRDDIRSAKWMKLVANAAEMVPSAVLNATLVGSLKAPGMRAVMDAAGTEALEAALAAGCRIVPIFGQDGIEDTPPEQYAAALLDAVLSGWSLEDTRVTVLQDWMKGRRAEGEEIHGLVVDVLTRAGRDAPYNALMLDLARKIESGELEAGEDNAALMVGVVPD
ncbi:2-dehydropantoate 2-reductase N-terminal domain-containing protein [Conexibacter sp. JD483]|uniref:ketopantoate reductase family protein n=1 Tax=unclassified Conexibacter TaxID=2627773 RepID=UPI002716A815|nr:MULTISPECIES: 2-dehydropantoate 2-reductase N-terminal domain-containing protein [unclassified Conexibacter]MDO8188358.1 2-dehydropantoate 2-reductase N-terminal domain-containing protein [Conexibacter sp. CPCC 205706]MDO8201104.1 2-dehydropantoate 2-reductase N-terminal domain-containing protein [Conexibacter sp. CPCC 205762]MDR9372158.1 2-dehydropantoate 2-reductase N-terminal domain-containing protein [Conexibacter sp. JD483]